MTAPKTARNARIVELHDEGRSLNEIARTLWEEGFDRDTQAYQMTSQNVARIVKQEKAK